MLRQAWSHLTMRPDPLFQFVFGVNTVNTLTSYSNSTRRNNAHALPTLLYIIYIYTFVYYTFVYI